MHDINFIIKGFTSDPGDKVGLNTNNIILSGCVTPEMLVIFFQLPDVIVWFYRRFIEISVKYYCNNKMGASLVRHGFESHAFVF